MLIEYSQWCHVTGFQFVVALKGFISAAKVEIAKP